LARSPDAYTSDALVLRVADDGAAARPNAARWTQQQLDEGRGVILGDAVNAHPSFCRKALREVFVENHLTPLYNLFNFTYGQATPLRSYNEEGDVCFELLIVTGQLQGCTSATPGFCMLAGSLLKKHAPAAIPKVRLIMDDCAVSCVTLWQHKRPSTR
jgi:hypothetical protein